MVAKKIVAIMLVFVMGLAVFSGCSKTEDNHGKQSTSGESSPSGSDSADKDKRPSFEYWHPIHAFTAKGMESHNEHPFAPRLAEETGVDVKYVNPPVGQEEEQLNLIFSSQNLPDAFHSNLSENYKGGVDGAIADGIIINATELIEEHAPNYMAMMSADEDVRRDSYTDEGTIKAFGSIIPAPEMRGLPFWGPFLNKKLLDKTGLGIPETIDDWETMLIAFKDMGIKAPFTWPANNTIGFLNDVFSGAYGVPSESEFFKEGNVVKYGPIQEGYREFLTLLNRWYEMGLLDADYLSRNMNKHVKPMLINGEAGATVAHLTNLEQLEHLAKADNKDIDLIAVPYPVLNKGDQIHFRHFLSNVKKEATFITTAADDPVTIVKWIDYLYSPEGIELTVWGDEGVTFEYDEQGNKKYTDLVENNPDGLPFSYARRQLVIHDIISTYAWDEQKIFYDTEDQHDAWERWQKADYENVLPESLLFTVEEQEGYSRIMSEVDTYVEEMFTKFVMGIESLDNFDQFVATIKDMGIDEATAYKQASYDRYLDR
ncbi:extracellular solute-binding protein [Vallitalea pronyensis]|uniref:Extracellular solute-binding protein n=1 Tax=Vallitalea pronyensis TaxID=1348613 RepID=A0A8J8MI45_9FIRM|nr:extracellular solute-binding protein [Vallitalea pronyensis]QUI22247.1 extracellular solute-binding protein [Vallitalea pronyensis]